MARLRINFKRDEGTPTKNWLSLPEESGRTQEDAANAMSRSQSVVSKCKLGFRRMDVVEVRQYLANQERSGDAFGAESRRIHFGG